ncbi:MAG: hypothetical protein KM296_00305 [Brockia lithotrophica]|nr:hypothetical protein [Brockia lithotrophica]
MISENLKANFGLNTYLAKLEITKEISVSNSYTYEQAHKDIVELRKYTQETIEKIISNYRAMEHSRDKFKKSARKEVENIWDMYVFLVKKLTSKRTSGLFKKEDTKFYEELEARIQHEKNVYIDRLEVMFENVDEEKKEEKAVFSSGIRAQNRKKKNLVEVFYNTETAL